MCGTMMLLKLTFLFFITWKCQALSQRDSGDDAGPCDNDAVMKVVEKLERRVEIVELLERRVEALEAENAQQRSEIKELKAAVEQNQEHQGEASTEAKDAPAAKSDDYAASHPTNRIRRASPELTIAFYATRLAEAHHLGQDQNVPFENVVTNVGNAYDGHVGVFRAPVGGVYVFSTTLVTYSRNTTFYAFALNGHHITAMYANGAENQWDSDSQTIILDLKTGDDVSVLHTHSDKSLHGGRYSLFSGFLLSMTDEGTSSIVG